MYTWLAAFPLEGWLASVADLWGVQPRVKSRSPLQRVLVSVVEVLQAVVVEVLVEVLVAPAQVLVLV